MTTHVDVQVQTKDGWQTLNRRTLKEGMSEAEVLAILSDVTRLKVGWESSSCFNDTHIRVHTQKVK
jgi:hypothetical protein